jgi:hypothetical protein
MPQNLNNSRLNRPPEQPKTARTYGVALLFEGRAEKSCNNDNKPHIYARLESSIITL